MAAIAEAKGSISDGRLEGGFVTRPPTPSSLDCKRFQAQPLVVALCYGSKVMQHKKRIC